MKLNLLPILVIISYLPSCNKNDKISLYNIENVSVNDRNEKDILVPLLDKTSFEKLLNVKASFPLLIYSPKCENTCSTFPYLFNIYLKENTVFFPLIYESVFSSFLNTSEIETSIYIYSKGKIINKTNIKYFNNHEISSYMNKYTSKNNIKILNNISYVSNESNLHLSSFISYKNETSNLTKELVKENDVLVINDNILESFNEEYYSKIKDFKYIYFSSYLNDDFCSYFNVEKHNNLYSKLSYSNEKFSLVAY